MNPIGKFLFYILFVFTIMAITNAVVNTMKAVDIYHKGLESHYAGNQDKALTLYKTAIRHPGANNLIRSSAYRNIGVIYHERLKKAVKEQDPAEWWASEPKIYNLFRMAGSSYIKAMKFERGSIEAAKNLQILFNEKLERNFDKMRAHEQHFGSKVRKKAKKERKRRAGNSKDDNNIDNNW